LRAVPIGDGDTHTSADRARWRHDGDMGRVGAMDSGGRFADSYGDGRAEAGTHDGQREVAQPGTRAGGNGVDRGWDALWRWQPKNNYVFTSAQGHNDSLFHVEQ